MLLDRCIKNNSEEKIKLTSDIQRLNKDKHGTTTFILSFHCYYYSYRAATKT